MKLNSAGDDFIARLRKCLPKESFREITESYLEEPRGQVTGRAGLVVAPGSVGDVSLIVKAAIEYRVPIIPYGGGTGLVGGQIMPDGPVPVILSLERLRKIRGVYPADNVIEVEAGAILADVQSAAASVGKLFPLSIAARGSARIGGILATNAGGVNVLRYGNARELCLGLEAVLPDGSIWNGMKRLRKDNMGYDLRNLLIGSEGTLGVITSAALKLSPIPANSATALLAVRNPACALDILSLASDQFCDGVNAFELMKSTSLEFIAEAFPEMKRPFADPPDWFVLVDVGLAKGIDPAESFDKLYLDSHARGFCYDGLVSHSEAQRREFWAIREIIPEANRRIGAICSHDISVPLGSIAEFIESSDVAMAALGTYRINCFGHLGDGNLHFNIFPPKGENRNRYLGERGVITQCIHDLVHGFGGSVGAEHGVGRLKIGDLERYADPSGLSAMRAIKTALDPAGIMNPGAVFRM
ncbi:MAG: FAD-binding oxidoreductase [Roseovarius sp.]|nr:FAD-binding oxidoreductase [Roseovarius sp.]